MSDERLELVEPNEALRDAFLAMLADYRQADEDRFQKIQRRAERDFAGLIEEWSVADATGHGEAASERVYWLVRDGRDVVGTARLRLHLPEAGRRIPGHIGFDVAPSARGRGYATFLLAAVLEQARSLGMGRVTLFCCQDNPPSARVIEKNRGRLDREFLAERCGKTCQQYWIEL